jgi:hypothetical protein
VITTVSSRPWKDRSAGPIYSPAVTETAPDDLSLPEALAEVFSIGFDWEWDDETETARSCDFEPYESFEAPARTAEWYRLWTGNRDVDGNEFRFFGSTGAGDYAGFWLIRPGAPIIDQPIVYLGSEGQRGVVARDLGDLLWLFAAGYGPAEAVEYRDSIQEPNDAFRAIAERHAPRPRVACRADSLGGTGRVPTLLRLHRRPVPVGAQLPRPRQDHVVCHRPRAQIRAQLQIKGPVPCSEPALDLGSGGRI